MGDDSRRRGRAIRLTDRLGERGVLDQLIDAVRAGGSGVLVVRGEPGVGKARRLLRLATTPMSQAARDLGYGWSRWRRRHQARARWHHYHAQLKAARVT